MPSDKQRLRDRDYYGEYQKKSCYTVEQWEKILANEAFVSPTELAILKEIFASANHTAPLLQLSYRHKKDSSYFIDKMNQLARNIGLPNGYSADVDLEGNEYWWYLLFWGKNNKLAGLEWKLIPELAEAIEYSFPDLEDKYQSYMSEIEHCEQIRYTREDAVWIASTLLLFEKVHLEHPMDIYDLLLMQYEISQRAQKVYGQDVDIEVITTNCNADSQRCSYHYLRDIDKYWRVCYPGELEDVALRPEKIDYNAYVFSKFGFVKLSELTAFLEGEYCKLTDPNYVEIDTSNPFYQMAHFIHTNGKKRYMDLTAPTEEDIEHFLAQKEEGKEALNAFHMLGDILKEQYPSFTQTAKASWLERDNTTIKSCWIDSFETAEYKGAGPMFSILCGKSDETDKVLFSVVLSFPIESTELTSQVLNKCENLTVLTSANFRVEKTLRLDSMYQSAFGNAVVAFAEFSEQNVLDQALQDVLINFETAIQILASYYLDICESCYQIPEPASAVTTGLSAAESDSSLQEQAPSADSVAAGSPVVVSAAASPKRLVPKKEHADRKEDNFFLYPKNILLQGPDGSGKFEEALRLAAGIIEGLNQEAIDSMNHSDLTEKYQRYRQEGRILFASGLHLDYEQWIDGPGGHGTFTAFSNHISDGRYVCIMEDFDWGFFAFKRSMGSVYSLLKTTRREGQPEESSVELTYSKDSFTLPSNLYFIGLTNDCLTNMNELDAFHICPVSPKTERLDHLIIKGLSIRYMTDAMNQRLSYLLGNNYQIGYRYFEPLLQNKSLELLGNIMHEVILPKLLTWFEDEETFEGNPYEGVRMVLGDYKKSSSAYEFIRKEILNPTAIFGMEMELDDKTTYQIQTSAFYDLNSYLEIE